MVGAPGIESGDPMIPILRCKFSALAVNYGVLSANEIKCCSRIVNRSRHLNRRFDTEFARLTAVFYVLVDIALPTPPAAASSG
jgi:hypothetical protein